jgi:predicted nucleic acid-binding protein
MEIDEIREILATVRAVCTIIPVDLETHDLALDLVKHHRFSTFDGLILAAALRARCTCLYSEDMQHGQVVNQLTIRNPFLGVRPIRAHPNRPAQTASRPGDARKPRR